MCYSNTTLTRVLSTTCTLLLGLILVLILAMAPAATTSGCEPDFNLTEVAPGVYVHQGTPVGLQDARRVDLANIGFIVGQRCVAVIDSGGAIATGEALKRALRDITQLPICYLINTHVHFDHVLGNFALKEADTRVVGHENLVAAMRGNAEFFRNEFAGAFGQVPVEQAIIPPDVLVQETLTLELGHRRLALHAYGPAHTNQDLTVFDNKTGIMWLGDLLFVDHVPTLDGSLNGWLQTLEELMELDIDKVIPGHGPVSVDWPEGALPQHRYLQRLRDETRAMIAKGASLEVVIPTVGMAEKDAWQLFDEHHRRNVTRAFKELEWE